MSKSHNQTHQKNLRTRKEVQADYQQTVVQIGHIISQVHLFHKQKGDLLNKVERLNKEQVKPDQDEVPPADPSPVVEPEVQTVQQ